MVTIDIPGFELVRTLGTGGFGSVWLARQPSVDRDVAIKIGHRPMDDTARIRFERECRALGRLSGTSNIVTVHVTGTLPDGRPYLVMEYIPGGTLWTRVERGPLTTPELATIGLELSDALGHAHRLGILHRDVKPDNVLLRSDGSIVLGDFGIAAIHDGPSTSSTMVTATVPFTAPEVLSGQRASTGSDLYGLGATVVAAASRSTPFVAGTEANVGAILHRVFTVPPPDLRLHGYPDDLAALVERLMAKDPADRPTAAGEIRAAFQQLVGSGRGPEERDPPRVGRITLAAPMSRGHGGSGPARESDPSTRVPMAAPVPSSPTLPEPSWPPGDGRPTDAQPVVANRGHGVGTSAARRKAPRRHPMVLAALAAAVVLAAGIGAYAAVRAGADRASPTGDTVVAGPSDDDTDPGATGSTTPEPTTSTAPTTDTTSTIEPSTTTTVELGPIGLPLTPEDAGLPADASVTEVDPGPGDHGFCNVSIPETGLEEQLATNLNHADGHETLNQTASRFESEDTAHAFFRAIADSNECRSSQHTTVNGEQGYTAATEILDPARAFGDEVLAYQTTLSFDSGSTRTARGYVVRRGDRVVSLFLSTDEPARLDQVPDLMALMLRRLGYDG